MKTFTSISSIFGSALALAACGGAAAPTLTSDQSAISERGDGKTGMVYSMSNDPTQNAIIAFARDSNGRLSSAGIVPTGGLGTGHGLGSQGAVTLHPRRSLLFAVNAASNQVSSFRVTEDGLVLSSVVSSGGDHPISVTAHDETVYVLNAGGAGNIFGFTLDRDGALTPISGSDRALSSATSGPAQIAFNPSGTLLVVTEKGTNVIDTYEVLDDGTTRGPTATASNGLTPFGFGFSGRDHLIVSEAFGGAIGRSAVSSYRVSAESPVPVVVSGSVPDAQSAACWIAVSKSGRFAYASNTRSGSISGYSIDENGTLEAFGDGGVTGTTGAAPIDMALSANGRFLYVVDAASADLSAFAVRNDGGLAPLPRTGGLPATAVGLAAR